MDSSGGTSPCSRSRACVQVAPCHKLTSTALQLDGDEDEARPLNNSHDFCTEKITRWSFNGKHQAEKQSAKTHATST